METLTIIVSAAAIVVSLSVTGLSFWKKKRLTRDAQKVADQRIHQLEMTIDQFKHLDPSRIAAQRSKIDKAERLLNEVVLH